MVKLVFTMQRESRCSCFGGLTITLGFLQLIVGIGFAGLCVWLLLSTRGNIDDQNSFGSISKSLNNSIRHSRTFCCYEHNSVVENIFVSVVIPQGKFVGCCHDNADVARILRRANSEQEILQYLKEIIHRIAAVGLVLMGANIASAIILLVGCFQQMPQLVLVWICLSVISAAMGFVDFLRRIAFSEVNALVIFAFVVQAIFVWIVWNFGEEILEIARGCKGKAKIKQ